VKRPRNGPVAVTEQSAFGGFRFPPEVIVVAIRWYLRYGLSYRDVEELLTERGVQVDHVRFTPLLADAARPCRHLIITAASKWCGGVVSLRQDQ
jgi:hypothetical protein